MIKIECKKSKKGTLYYVLSINDTYVCFDVVKMAIAFKIKVRDIYLLNEGEYIEYNERS